jgi:hypothetical protein
MNASSATHLSQEGEEEQEDHLYGEEEVVVGEGEVVGITGCLTSILYTRGKLYEWRHMGVSWR